MVTSTRVRAFAIVDFELTGVEAPDGSRPDFASVTLRCDVDEAVWHVETIRIAGPTESARRRGTDLHPPFEPEWLAQVAASALALGGR